ncbi:hypothetical protein I79_000078 [Cricetulus griseus]|uniref:Uncharacterized protein n=1 Tax=Cricetulus griseus TaxID=10029 RepID=G3GRD5_CRIGR|nr:hypothetical protein I79_000078 [Cricetulus griseus]
MPPQDLTALGAFVPCLPSLHPPTTRTTADCEYSRDPRARRALHTTYHGFMLPGWSALLPQNPFVFYIPPKFSFFFHIIVPVTRHFVTGHLPSLLSKLVTDAT